MAIGPGGPMQPSQVPQVSPAMPMMGAPPPMTGDEPLLPGMDAPPPPEMTGIQREPPDIPESRRAGVAKLLGEIQLDKQHWEPDYKQMRADMNFARGWQWPDQTSWDDDRYVANLVQRHINQRVSALYAKNPVFTAKRREKMDFAIWDGNPQELQMAAQAQQAAATAGPGVTAMVQPQAMMQVTALLQDVQQGMALKKQTENLAKTLELVWKYQIDEQIPVFKTQAKQLVRRAITCGVSWLKLGYQRQMEKIPQTVDKIADVTVRISHLQAMLADVADDEINPDSAEMEELRKTLETLQSEPDVLVNEGASFDYPASWAVIPDRRCRQLKGFVGCDRVSEEFLMSPQDIKEMFGVDVGKNYTAYTVDKVDTVKLQAMGAMPGDGSLACVYQVYERKSGTVCFVVEGWPDYLRAPVSPFPWLERFWPWFALSFNDGEHDTKVYPVSDVFLLRSEQREYNRCREGLRRHRIANRPKTVVSSGVLSEEDAENMKTHPDNAIIEIQGMQPGQKVDDLFQPYKGPMIDPALYNVDAIFQDILRIVGSQEANLGGTASNVTATESSIAESSRLSSLQSNIDDLDDFLSDVANSGSEICFLNISAETVKEIVGPGAVWPELTRQEVADEFFLEVKAGSSGRPNKAQEMQNMNMILPYLMQMPGIDPYWLATQVLTRMDDRLDVGEALARGMPSITAMNNVSQPQSAAAPAPEGGDVREGQQGNQNAPQPEQGAQGNAMPPRTGPRVPVSAEAQIRASA